MKKFLIFIFLAVLIYGIVWFPSYLNKLRKEDVEFNQRVEKLIKDINEQMEKLKGDVNFLKSTISGKG